MVTTNHSLRFGALAVHRAEIEDRRRRSVEAEKAAQIEQADHLSKLLLETFNIMAYPLENEWMHDGIVFHAAFDGYGQKWFLFISEACPVCEGRRISSPVRDLNDLGAALSGEVWRSHEHYWAEDSPNAPTPPPVVAPPPTVEERLIDALRAFVEEYTLGGGSDA